MALGKAEIISALKVKTETLPVDGGEIILSQISAAEFSEAQDSPLSKGEDGKIDGIKFVSLLATRCIVDDTGARLFADEDAETLRQGNVAVYRKIAATVQRITGLNGDEKNSEPSPSDSSPSGSA